MLPTARNEVCGWPEPPVGCFSMGLPQWGSSKPLFLAASVPAQLPAIAARRGEWFPYSQLCPSRYFIPLRKGEPGRRGQVPIVGGMLGMQHP